MLRPTARRTLLTTSTATFLCTALLTAGGAAQAAKTCATSDRAQVVVKMDVAGGHSLNEVLDAYPVQVSRNLVPSRGISLVRSTDPEFCADKKWAKKLAGQLERADGVLNAEPDYDTEVSDGRFHAWPSGPPAEAGQDPAAWRSQPAVRALHLDRAHETSTGAGQIVAVLDTGVASHPALATKVLRGWDYVEDDADSDEERNGLDDDGDGHVDESFGHGTFISGLVTLVAPDARVLPLRVLDSDGQGNTFVVAQAIDDAVQAGAGVINMSFGTAVKPGSDMLDDALKRAAKQGVVIVAAAGNAGTDDHQYPAAHGDVIAVNALAEDESRLADFSTSGDWVDVAAPGERIAGPVPGGGYAWWSGTSIAAPLVAGQVALIEARGRHKDAKHIVEAVTKTARKLTPKDRPKARAIDVLGSLARD